jgi:ABC-type multidrug transport system fused ATPase/permease subunit
VLHNIGTAKLYGYESFFVNRICSFRTREIALLKWAGFVTSITAGITLGSAILPSVVSFVIYVGVGGTLTPSLAFTTLSLFYGAYFMGEMFGIGLSKVENAQPSFERLNQLMQLPEMDSSALETRIPATNDGDPWVTLDNCTFRYHGSTVHALNNVSLVGRPGQFIMVRVLLFLLKNWCFDTHTSDLWCSRFGEEYIVVGNAA